jgi:hypothetical protein
MLMQVHGDDVKRNAMRTRRLVLPFATRCVPVEGPVAGAGIAPTEAANDLDDLLDLLAPHGVDDAHSSGDAEDDGLDLDDFLPTGASYCQREWIGSQSAVADVEQGLGAQLDQILNNCTDDG